VNIRPTQATTFALVKNGLLSNFAKLARAQEQLASGKRILRASDDPVGASRATSLREQLATQARYTGAVLGGRTRLDAASAALQEASGLIAEVRSITVQGMNGVMTAEDRSLLAGQVDLIRSQLLDVANRQLDNRFLFAGTATNVTPFSSSELGGQSLVTYAGNQESQQMLVGLGTTVASNLPGSAVFAATQQGQTSFGAVTGVAAGQSANQGSGYEFLQVRHESTATTLGGGIALVSGGALDTIMGAHTITVDAALGTVQLDSGIPQALPTPGSPNIADFTLLNSQGAEVHLDFTGYSGVSTSGSATGAGSASLDGTNWTPLTFTSTDLQLADSESGVIVHVDETGIHRSGREMIVFGGSVNLFDTLQGISDALVNSDGAAPAALVERLELMLGELDRNHENLIGATGILGSRSQRLTSMEARYEDSEVLLRGLLSGVEDVDFSQVVLDMTRAEQTLQTAQAAGARLLQNSLLNFIR
jgi:flagellar hook-associated protein 3 FlgL